VLVFAITGLLMALPSPMTCSAQRTTFSVRRFLHRGHRDRRRRPAFRDLVISFLATLAVMVVLNNVAGDVGWTGF
jgi:hypothetical protein